VPAAKETASILDKGVQESQSQNFTADMSSSHCHWAKSLEN
jgi:hypothetical protein